MILGMMNNDEVVCRECWMDLPDNEPEIDRDAYRAATPTSHPDGFTCNICGARVGVDGSNKETNMVSIKINPLNHAFEAWKARTTSQRQDAIDKLVAEAPANAKDRSYWSLVYDLERAPIATNRSLLAEIGIDADTATLMQIAEGLAMFSTYLINTDFYTDDQILEHLRSVILNEEVRVITPGCGGREFIDMASGFESVVNIKTAPRVADRDRHLPRPTG